ncbi:MAG TPA: transcription termination factor Rho, partial [Pirellulales bacterium]|nr:transcription termination factor Rho [Pirellulales bacterium]
MGKKKRSRGGRGNQGPGPYHNNGHQQRGRGRRRPMGDRGGPMGDRPPMNDIMEEPTNGEPVPTEPALGILELHPNGYGFLRDPKNNYQRERTDPFVPGTMIEKFGLREGVLINGLVQQSRKQQGPRLREIVDVDGIKPDDYLTVKNFDSLTPINPESWLRLETGSTPLSPRVMDLLTPLGKGQRALIVAPPRTGKTILLQQISQAISANYPDVKMFVLLVDE